MKLNLVKRPKRTFAAPLFLGFDAVSQLTFLVQPDQEIDSRERIAIDRLSGSLVGEAQRTGTVTGLAAKIARDLEVLLLCSPVDVREQQTGRAGLCLIIGIAVAGKRRPTSDMAVQLIRLCEQLLCTVVDESVDKFVDAMSEITLALQQDTAYNTLDRLSWGVANLRGYMTVMHKIADSSGLVSNSGEAVVRDDRDDLLNLVKILASQYRATRSNQFGHAIPMSSLGRGHPPLEFGVSVHHMSQRTLFISQSFDDFGKK